ncbi:MAG: acetyltransferase [Paludibacter sp.]|nr:acetyltransferase [Paludibacter sp.]
MKDIAIYGAGGFGKEIACMINNKMNEIKPTWNIVGFFDDGVKKGTQISHLGTVLGSIDDLNFWESDLSIVFAIGSPKIIQLLVSKIINSRIDFPNIIHPSFELADPSTVIMGKGNVIARGVTFSCDVTIGDFNQFNSISALAHDVVVGSYNVFMPLVRVSGEAVIGNFNFFGIGAIILQQIKIGNNTRVGAGSILMSKTKDGFLYMGNPARKMDF